MAANRFWVVTGMLMAALAFPLSAYQQGSYFLFDIREDSEASTGTAGRVALQSSIFKKALEEAEQDMAKNRGKSAFETGISDFELKGGSDVTTGIKILDESEEGSEKESSFGDTPAPSGGFFFTY